MVVNGTQTILPSLTYHFLGDSGTDIKERKLELALAQSSNYQKLSSGILSNFSASFLSADTAGLSAALMYKIYDNMAITPGILNAYKDKMTDAIKEEAKSDEKTAQSVDVSG